MNQINLTVAGIPLTFTDQSAMYSGREYIYSKMTNVRSQAGNAPAFIFDYEGEVAAIPYETKDADTVMQVFRWAVSNNEKMKQQAAPIAPAAHNVAPPQQSVVAQNNINVTNNENGKSYFDGGLAQYVGYNLLGALVTSLTLGICLPWAYCMIYNWEIKHTVVDGQRLQFDGTAAQLFGNWIKWLLLTFITLGIYGFWLSIKLKKWKVKHTSFVTK